MADALTVERHDAELDEFWSALGPRYEADELTIGEAFGLCAAEQQRREDSDSAYRRECERRRIRYLEQQAREYEAAIPRFPNEGMDEAAREHRRWAQERRNALTLEIRQMRPAPVRPRSRPRRVARRVTRTSGSRGDPPHPGSDDDPHAVAVAPLGVTA